MHNNGVIPSRPVKSLFFITADDQIPQENDEPKIRFIKRDYDASIVDACGGSGLEKNQQEQLLKIVDAINLKPVCLLSSDGEEQFMLVHEKHFSRICKSHFISILPVCENENNTIS
ncbi:hypothetical protein INT45_004187 [Circinella minor]|uniref:Uncharacterized protein n=1 Tax=Circinella minor TaxID=1195481 RepID=A0A8H7VH90_9FUNG|nr:hypothetical protein INT45_004187 [Circinella minor]